MPRSVVSTGRPLDQDGERGGGSRDRLSEGKRRKKRGGEEDRQQGMKGAEEEERGKRQAGRDRKRDAPYSTSWMDELRRRAVALSNTLTPLVAFFSFFPHPPIPHLSRRHASLVRFAQRDGWMAAKIGLALPFADCAPHVEKYVKKQSAQRKGMEDEGGKQQAPVDESGRMLEHHLNPRQHRGHKHRLASTDSSLHMPSHRHKRQHQNGDLPPKTAALPCKLASVYGRPTSVNDCTITTYGVTVNGPGRP
eukprot:3601259-Rhodomonas_salina.1